MDSIDITPEHELLREQVVRFIAPEVEPHALATAVRDTGGGGATEVMLDEVAKRYWSTPRKCLRHSHPKGSSKVAEPHFLKSCDEPSDELKR